MPKQKLSKTLITLFFLLTIIGGLFAYARPAQAILGMGDIVFDPVAETRRILTFIWDKGTELAKENSAVLWKNVQLYFGTRMANDAAEFLASGGNTQEPMFWDDNFKGLQELADATAGEFLDNLSTDYFGKSICEPGDINMKIDITMAARRMGAEALGEAKDWALSNMPNVCEEICQETAPVSYAGTTFLTKNIEATEEEKIRKQAVEGNLGEDLFELIDDYGNLVKDFINAISGQEKEITKFAGEMVWDDVNDTLKAMHKILYDQLVAGGEPADDETQEEAWRILKEEKQYKHLHEELAKMHDDSIGPMFTGPYAKLIESWILQEIFPHEFDDSIEKTVEFFRGRGDPVSSFLFESLFGKKVMSTDDRKNLLGWYYLQMGYRTNVLQGMKDRISNDPNSTCQRQIDETCQPFIFRMFKKNQQMIQSGALRQKVPNVTNLTEHIEKLVELELDQIDDLEEEGLSTFIESQSLEPEDKDYVRWKIIPAFTIGIQSKYMQAFGGGGLTLPWFNSEAQFGNYLDSHPITNFAYTVDAIGKQIGIEQEGFSEAISNYDTCVQTCMSADMETPTSQCKFGFLSGENYEQGENTVQDFFKKGGTIGVTDEKLGGISYAGAGLGGEETWQTQRGPWQQSLLNARDYDSEVNVSNLQEFGEMFAPENNPLGQLLDITQETQRVSSEQKRQLEVEAQSSGYKPKRGRITGTEIPAGEVGQRLDRELRQVQDINNQYTGSVLAQMWGTFFNTFVERLMKNIYDKGLNPRLGARGLSMDFEARSAFGVGVSFAKRMYEMDAPQVTSTESLDLINTLASCPQREQDRSFNNCIIDGGFRNAIAEKLTVQEAIDKPGYLDGEAPFGFSGPGGEMSHDNYDYQNMKVLRHYRVISSGWELAAEYIKQNVLTKPGANWVTLQEVVWGFNDPKSPYFRLVDPDWLLKLPENRCNRLGAGEDIITEQGIETDDDSQTPPEVNVVRRDFCADEQSCVRETLDGKACREYGYCTREKTVWRFSAEPCQPEDNTCQAYVDNLGQGVSYLKNSLDFEGCGSANKGCQGLMRDASASEIGKLGKIGKLGNWEIGKLIPFVGKEFKADVELIPVSGSTAIYNETKAHPFDGVGDCGEGASFNSPDCPDIVISDDEEQLTTMERNIQDSPNPYLTQVPTLWKCTNERDVCYYERIPGEPEGCLFENGQECKPWIKIEGDPPVLRPYHQISRVLGENKYWCGLPGGAGCFVSDESNATVNGLTATITDIDKIHTTTVAGTKCAVTAGFKDTNPAQAEAVPDPEDPTQALYCILGDESRKTYIDDDAPACSASSSNCQQYFKLNFTPDAMSTKNEKTNALENILSKAKQDGVSYANLIEDIDAVSAVANISADEISGFAPVYLNDEKVMCSEKDVSCKNYYSQSSGDNIPGVLNGRRDLCPETCAGYDVYVEELTELDALLDPSFETLYFHRLIPQYEDQCSVQNVGCEAFTNIDDQEKIEYLTKIRHCVKPEDAGINKAVYYTFEGADSGLYQPKYWTLLKSNIASATTFNVVKSDDATVTATITVPTGLPCTNFDSANKVCVDVFDDNYLFDDLNENDLLDEDEPVYLKNPVANAIAICNDLSNLNCRKFYDEKGNIYKVLQNRTITVSENCQTYRRKEDGENYNFISSEVAKWQCPANAEGCRNFQGPHSASSREIFSNDFEYTLGDWQGGSQTNNAVQIGGKSLQISDSTAFKNFTSSTQEQGTAKSFVLSFWAQGASGATLTADVQECASNHSNCTGAPFNYTIASNQSTTTAQNLDLDDDWTFYQIGPAISLKDGALFNPNFVEITVSGTVNIDSISLREVSDTYYLIKNANRAWRVPQECDTDLGKERYCKVTALNGQVPSATGLITVPDQVLENQLANAITCDPDTTANCPDEGWECSPPLGTEDDICTVLPDKTHCQLPPLSAPGYYLGCQAYQDSYSAPYYFKSIDLCDPEKVGCQALINTFNTDSANAQYWARIGYDESGAPIVDNKLSLEKYDQERLESLTGIELADAEYTVPEDVIEYMVVSPGAQCSASAVGCSLFGRPEKDYDNKITGFEPVYKIDLPDSYAEVNSPICRQSEENCNEFKKAENTGDKNYFKHPGNYTCQYKSSADSAQQDWYKTGTGKKCENKVSLIDGAGTLELTNNIKWCQDENHKDILSGGAPYSCEPGDPDPCEGFTGDADSKCTGFLKDANIYINKSLEQIRIPARKWCQMDVGEPNELWQDIIHSSGYRYACNNDYDCQHISDKHFGALPNAGIAIDKDKLKCRSFVKDNRALKCLASESRCTEFVDPRPEESTQDSYYVINDDKVVSQKGCEDNILSLGCRIFYDSSKSEPTLSSKASVKAAEEHRSVASCGASPYCDEEDYNDANILLSVERDRTCAEWLACRSSMTAKTIESLGGKNETFCLDLAACDQWGTEPGACARFAELPYNQFVNFKDANPPEKTVYYKDANDDVVHQAFNNIFQMPLHIQEQEIQANKDFEQLSRERLSTLSGYSKAGMTWQELYQPYSDVSGFYPFRSLRQLGNYLNISNGDFEEFSPFNNWPAGWNTDTCGSVGSKDGSACGMVYRWQSEGGQIVESRRRGSQEVTERKTAIEINHNKEVRFGFGALQIGTGSSMNDGRYVSQLFNNMQQGTKYVISFWINTKNAGVDDAGKAGAAIVEYNKPITDKGENAKPRYVDDDDNDAENAWNGNSDISSENNKGWHYQARDFTLKQGTKAIRIELFNNTSGQVYFDNVQVRPHLEISSDLWVSPSCRLYPNTDSLLCDGQNEQGQMIRGWRGYCAEYAFGNSGECVSWWPLDIISGELSVFADITQAGYQERAPLYYCGQAKDKFTPHKLPRMICAGLAEPDINKGKLDYKGCFVIALASDPKPEFYKLQKGDWRLGVNAHNFGPPGDKYRIVQSYMNEPKADTDCDYNEYGLQVQKISGGAAFLNGCFAVDGTESWDKSDNYFLKVFEQQGDGRMYGDSYSQINNYAPELEKFYHKVLYYVYRNYGKNDQHEGTFAKGYCDEVVDGNDEAQYVFAKTYGTHGNPSNCSHVGHFGDFLSELQWNITCAEPYCGFSSDKFDHFITGTSNGFLEWDGKDNTTQGAIGGSDEPYKWHYDYITKFERQTRPQQCQVLVKLVDNDASNAAWASRFTNSSQLVVKPLGYYSDYSCSPYGALAQINQPSDIMINVYDAQGRPTEMIQSPVELWHLSNPENNDEQRNQEWAVCDQSYKGRGYYSAGDIQTICRGGKYEGNYCFDDEDCKGGVCGFGRICEGGVNMKKFCYDDADCPDGECVASKNAKGKPYVVDGVCGVATDRSGRQCDRDSSCCNDPSNCPVDACISIDIPRDETVENHGKPRLQELFAKSYGAWEWKHTGFDGKKGVYGMEEGHYEWAGDNIQWDFREEGPSNQICYDITKENYCNSNILCQWSSARSTCKLKSYFSCNGLRQSDCQNNFLCRWDSGSCQLSCSQYSSGGSCSANSCFWSTIRNMCEPTHLQQSRAMLPVQPKIKYLKINDQEKGNIEFNTDSESVTLTFQAEIDPDALPLRQIRIDWGDGEITIFSSLNWASGEYRFNHTYEYHNPDERWPLNVDSTYGDEFADPRASGAEAEETAEKVCDDDSCQFVPRVQIRDNWGWCNTAQNSNEHQDSYFEAGCDDITHTEAWYYYQYDTTEPGGIILAKGDLTPITTTAVPYVSSIELLDINGQPIPNNRINAGETVKLCFNITQVEREILYLVVEWGREDADAAIADADLVFYDDEQMATGCVNHRYNTSQTTIFYPALQLVINGREIYDYITKGSVILDAAENHKKEPIYWFPQDTTVSIEVES